MEIKGVYKRLFGFFLVLTALAVFFTGFGCTLIGSDRPLPSAPAGEDDGNK